MHGLNGSEQYWHRFCGFTTLLDHALVFRFEVQFIDLITPQQRRVAGIGDLHLAQHLPHNDLDVLIVNLYALEPVNFLNFVDKIFLQTSFSRNPQDILRDNRSVNQLFTGYLIAEAGEIKLLRESFNPLAMVQAQLPNGVADVGSPSHEVHSF